MTIATYIHNQSMLHNTLFRIEPDGKGYYIHEGTQYTREQFQKMFPLPISFIAYRRNNADRTKVYLQD